jgi:signal transduction histidine kinase
MYMESVIHNVNSGHDQTMEFAERPTYLDTHTPLSGDYARLYLEAKETNRLKDEFLALTAHELRAPLMAVLGWTQILRSKKLDDAAASRALDAIERSARAQAQLIEDLLDLARIASGKLRLDIRPVDPAAVIEAAVNMALPAAEAKGIKLQTALDLRGETVLGDAGRLQQVLWNLLSNAVKFTPGGGHVTVRLERQGSWVAIIVSDTGRGISPDFLPYLFDRFRQADGSSNREGGGLGLGLALAHELVTLHGGTIQGQSAGNGKGAVFTVTLPLAAFRAGEKWAIEGKRSTQGRALAAACAHL